MCRSILFDISKEFNRLKYVSVFCFIIWKKRKQFHFFPSYTYFCSSQQRTLLWTVKLDATGISSHKYKKENYGIQTVFPIFLFFTEIVWIESGCWAFCALFFLLLYFIISIDKWNSKKSFFHRWCIDTKKWFIFLFTATTTAKSDSFSSPHWW